MMSCRLIRSLTLLTATLTLAGCDRSSDGPNTAGAAAPKVFEGAVIVQMK